MIEGMLGVREVRHRLEAELLEEGEVFLASLERLLHRDHAVPEHSGLGHGVSGPYPIASPASRKISRAMMRRWISLVPS